MSETLREIVEREAATRAVVAEWTGSGDDPRFIAAHREFVAAYDALEAAKDGLVAAALATTPSPTPGLDVERLARAWTTHYGSHPTLDCGPFCADDLAAEYARLATTTEETTDG